MAAWAGLWKPTSFERGFASDPTAERSERLGTHAGHGPAPHVTFGGRQSNNLRTERCRPS
jgi:hypothetical protein